jgi:hypothetical protein
MQNFYCPGKYVTTATRNAQIIVYFDQPRDLNVVKILGMQIDPSKPKFLVEAYKKATSRKFGYLFIDLQPTTDKRYRVREGTIRYFAIHFCVRYYTLLYLVSVNIELNITVNIKH